MRAKATIFSRWLVATWVVLAAGCASAAKTMCVMGSMGTEGWTKCDKMDFTPPPSDDELLSDCRAGDLLGCASLLDRDWETAGYTREANLVLDGFCKQGRGDACTMRAEHTKPVDLALARHACELGDAHGCTVGARNAPDAATKLDFLELDCRVNKADCYEVVRFHLDAGDQASARAAAVAGCRQGDDASCYAVGRFAVGGPP